MLEFENLGFSKNEVVIFLGLAELGKATAPLVAKRTGLNRTTTYSVLDALSRKGLVTKEQKKGVTFFIANKPENLLLSIENERKLLDAKEEETKSLIETLKPFFQKRNFSIPKLQFYEGKAAIEAMLFEQSLLWQESVIKYDSTWWGFQDHIFVENYFTWLEWYWKRKLPNEEIKLVSNAAPIEDSLRNRVKGREVRVLRYKLNFTSTMWVMGDYVVVLKINEKPHHAFLLQDSFFAENMRNIFKLLWEIAT